MPRIESGFEWPQVMETTTHALVGSRLFEPFIEERRSQNATEWNSRRNWKLGFYFGKADTRLWVPRRLNNGMAQESQRVINFAHPRGRGAFRILMLAYGIATIAIILVASIALGVRW